MSKASERDLVRINVDLEREIHARLVKHIPWGTRNKLLRLLLISILEGVERKGPIMVGAILGGEWEIRYTPDKKIGRISSIRGEPNAS